MSEAIKFMVRNGWEDNPEIRPGDIFANNQPTIGDVHNADVQTFVPIFDPDDPSELIGWAGGVIHVMDIGATTPGGVSRRADDPLRRRHRPALHEDRRARHDRPVAHGSASRCRAAPRASTCSTSAPAWPAAT